MKIKYLKGQDKQKTRSLWEEIFNTDSKDFVDYYYKDKILDNEILILEEDNKIVSMLHLNSYNINFNKRVETINYIVGVATKEEYRKRGYMRKMLIKSFKDMYSLEQPFTFLMPAAEEIYTPFDFHYIYSQLRYFTKDAEGIGSFAEEIKIYEADHKDIENLCLLSNKLLKENFDIFTYRCSDYYFDLLKEVKACEGSILLCYHNNILVGYAICEKEDSNMIHVREILCQDAYGESVLGHIIRMNKSIGMNINLVGINNSIIKKLQDKKLKNKPIIMARIIHLENFVESITCQSQIRLIINVIDEIIMENNGVFVWNINKHGSFLTGIQEELSAAQISDNIKVNNVHTDKAELTIPIRYLAAWLFGYVSIQELFNNQKIKCTEDCLSMLKLINPYKNVFINEMV